MATNCVIERDGILLDELAVDDLRIRVSRTGAELVSIARRSGEEWAGFLHRDGDPSVPASGWANHATVMGYFLHRLWKGESLYRGVKLSGGNHGFLRHYPFRAPEVTGDGLVYSVEADAVPRDAYPLRVSLRLAYRIIDNAVRVEFAFQNEEAQLDAHVSFGLHPGFAVTSLSQARILLPPGRYTRYMAPDNFLNGETRVVEVSTPGMPFPVADLPGSFLLALEAVPDRVVTLEDPLRGTRVSLDLGETPYLTLWSDADTFVCIEPCWGLPDSNPPVAFEKKIGIQTIPAGGMLRRSFTISPGFLK